MYRETRVFRAAIIGLALALTLVMGGCPTSIEDGAAPADSQTGQTSDRGGANGRTSDTTGDPRAGNDTDDADGTPTNDRSGPDAPPGAPKRPDEAGQSDRSDTRGDNSRDSDSGTGNASDSGNDPDDGGTNDPGNAGGGNDPGNGRGGDAGNDPGNGGGDGQGDAGGGNDPGNGGGQNDPTGGAPDLQGDELAFIEAMVAGARRAMTRGNEHVRLVTQAVFIVSGANGGALTTTGTLTFDDQGNATAYDPSPADRMVLVGRSSRVEYRIAGFAGDFSGTFEFEQSHSDLRFQATIEADCDLAIRSVSNNGQFERHIDGAVMLSRGPAQVSIVHGDGSQFDPDAAQLFSGTSVTGTVEAGGGTIAVRELFDTKFIGSVFQFKLAIASTAQRAGRNYECRDVFYAMVERDGFPVEPDFWRDNGQLMRDGAAIGDFDLDRIISPDLPSPGRVLRLISGVDIGV